LKKVFVLKKCVTAVAFFLKVSEEVATEIAKNVVIDNSTVMNTV